MTSTKGRLLGTAIAATAVVAAGNAAATTYSYATITIPGAAGTTASGINDSGVVAGSYFVYETIDGLDYAVFHGFVFDHGSSTTIDVPGAASTSVTGIGNDGTVGGFYFPDISSGKRYAFIMKNGVYQTFGKTGYVTELTSLSRDGTYAVAVSQSYSNRLFEVSTEHNGVVGGVVLKGYHGYTYGINDHGVAVGQIGKGINQPAVVIPQDVAAGKPRKPQPLPFSSKAGASVDGINDSNTVVGTFFDTNSGMTLGYTGAGDTITPLTYPGAKGTYAQAINNAGDVLGFAALAGGYKVYVLHGGTYTPLDGIPTTSFLFGVVAINAGGQVLANTGSIIYVATPQ